VKTNDIWMDTRGDKLHTCPCSVCPHPPCTVLDIYIYIYIYTDTHTHTHTQTHTHTHTHIDTHTHTCCSLMPANLWDLDDALLSFFHFLVETNLIVNNLFSIFNVLVI
jgi:hypothetical protein